MSGTNMSLQDLIESRRQGRSYQVLADACDGQPTAGRWWQIAKKGISAWPAPDVIRGIARALGVSEASVIFATANSLGFRMQEPSRLAGLLPASAGDLNDEQVTAVLGIVAAMNPGNAARDV